MAQVPAGQAATRETLALGEAMVEFNQSSPGQPAYLQGFGGDTSNFCIAAARQGARTGFVSAVGDDHFGRLLLDLWRWESVDTSTVRIDAHAPTGVYFVSHGAHGHQFDYLRAGSAASGYAPHDLPLDAIAAAKVVHLSGISLAISVSACDAALAAIEHARAHGVRVSFDTNLRLKLWPLARSPVERDSGACSAPRRQRHACSLSDRRAERMNGASRAARAHPDSRLP